MVFVVLKVSTETIKTSKYLLKIKISHDIVFLSKL